MVFLYRINYQGPTYKEGFIYCCAVYMENKRGHAAINSDVCEIVRKGELIGAMEFLCLVLKPLADAIAVLEQNSAKITDIWPCFLTINKYLRSELNPAKLPAKYMDVGNYTADRLSARAIDFQSVIYI